MNYIHDLHERNQNYIPEVLRLVKQKAIKFPIHHLNRWIVINPDPDVRFKSLEIGQKFKFKHEEAGVYFSRRGDKVTPIYEKTGETAYKLVGGFPPGTKTPVGHGFCHKGAFIKVVK